VIVNSLLREENSGTAQGREMECQSDRRLIRWGVQGAMTQTVSRRLSAMPDWEDRYAGNGGCGEPSTVQAAEVSLGGD
jgi:hypothetical protein